MFHWSGSWLWNTISQTRLGKCGLRWSIHWNDFGFGNASVYCVRKASMFMILRGPCILQSCSIALLSAACCCLCRVMPLVMILPEQRTWRGYECRNRIPPRILKRARLLGPKLVVHSQRMKAADAFQVCHMQSIKHHVFHIVTLDVIYLDHVPLAIE